MMAVAEVDGWPLKGSAAAARMADTERFSLFYEAQLFGRAFEVPEAVAQAILSSFTRLFAPLVRLCGVVDAKSDGQDRSDYCGGGQDADEGRACLLVHVRLSGGLIKHG